MNQKVGRNDPCPCGSGKKYKACCLKKEQAKRAPRSMKMRSVKTLQGGISNMLNQVGEMNKEIEKKVSDRKEELSSEDISPENLEP